MHDPNNADKFFSHHLYIFPCSSKPEEATYRFIGGRELTVRICQY